MKIFPCLVIVFVLYATQQTTYGFPDADLTTQSPPKENRKEKALMVNDQAKVIARFIDDFTLFVESVVDSVKSLLTPATEKNPAGASPTTHNFQMMMKYMSKSVKYGFQALKSSIPVLRVTKDNVIEVSNVLPSVPITDFIEDLVKQFTPAFSRTFDQDRLGR